MQIFQRIHISFKVAFNRHNKSSALTLECQTFEDLAGLEIILPVGSENHTLVIEATVKFPKV